MLSGRFKTTVNMSGLNKLTAKLKRLGSAEVEFGWYDKPHYSGITVGYLALIHTQGRQVPARNFNLQAGLSMRWYAPLYGKAVRDILVRGRSALVALQPIGVAGAKVCEFVIDSGQFTPNTVSSDWAAVKGFNNAMIHYGDLKDSVEFKINLTRGI